MQLNVVCFCPRLARAGLFFPILWIVSALLPLCIRDIHIKRAGVVSAVLLVFIILAGIVLGGTMGSRYGHGREPGYGREPRGGGPGMMP